MRPISVSVGGLASASATAISASQSVPAAAAVVIDSTLSSGYSATNIATTTNNGASTTTVTLNGSLVANGVAALGTPKRIVLVSAGNDSAKTWTVKGTDANGAYLSESVTAANTSRTSTTNYFLTVTSVTLSSGSAGNVSVGTNGIATLDTPRRITLTSGGNDTGITFTVIGTDVNNGVVTEAITGASGGAATSNVSYKTVTSIVASGATATTLTVGSAATATSMMVRFDDWAPSNISVQCTVSGTVNYTLQSTLDDPNDPTNPVARSSMTWVSSSDTNVVGATSTQQSNFLFAPKYARVLLNSGTGTVTATFVQNSNGPA